MISIIHAIYSHFNAARRVTYQSSIHCRQLIPTTISPAVCFMNFIFRNFHQRLHQMMDTTYLLVLFLAVITEIFKCALLELQTSTAPVKKKTLQETRLGSRLLIAVVSISNLHYIRIDHTIRGPSLEVLIYIKVAHISSSSSYVYLCVFLHPHLFLSFFAITCTHTFFFVYRHSLSSSILYFH